MHVKSTHFSPGVGGYARSLLSVKKCEFILSLTPPRSRCIIHQAVFLCKCGTPVCYCAPPKASSFYGCFCPICSLKDVPCLD